MNCTKCGQPLAVGEQFCGACGAPRPAADARFRRVEDQYFILKGQLTTGRIMREQFEAALKELVVQDAEGRWWMLGADSGKWYVSDGRNWVEANPSGVAPATAPPLVSSPVYVVPMPTPVQPPAPTRSQRTSSGGCCGPCLVVLIVSVVAVVLLGAAFYSNIPQLRERAATTIAAMASPTPKPALNLCTLMPPDAPKTTDKVATYIIPNTWGESFPSRACYIPYAEGEPRILIEQYATPAYAQRMEEGFRICANANSGCPTSTGINLGDGGFESESRMDPDCELKMVTHQLIWRRGCLVVRVEIYARPITPAQVKQLWDWARPLDAKLQTLPACPE